MSEARIKTTVLDLLRMARHDEQHFVASLTAAERAATGTLDHFSPKDMLAHIASWKRRHAEKLAAAARGETPPSWRDMDLVDQLNAETYATFQHHSWPDVLAESERAYDDLVAQVERLSEDELTAPDRYAWQEGEPLWAETLGNGAWHPFEHLIPFYRERGELDHVARLQATLLAAHENLVGMARETRAPPRMLGGMLYNLACLYATSGQPNRALPLLAEALRLRPGLVKWSQQDHDLDSLRALPAFQALYAQ